MPISNFLPSSRIAQPGVCTSTTRPASPYNGQVIYEIDTYRTQVWDGATWRILGDVGAWTSYTPTVTQGVTITTSNVVAKYKQLGKTVHVSIRFTTTSTGSGGNALLVSLPVQANATIGGMGIVSISGSGTNTYTHNQAILWSSYTQFGALSTTGNWWGINPATSFASGEAVYAQLTYEAA